MSPGSVHDAVPFQDPGEEYSVSFGIYVLRTKNEAWTRLRTKMMNRQESALLSDEEAQEIARLLAAGGTNGIADKGKDEKAPEVEEANEEMDNTPDWLSDATSVPDSSLIVNSITHDYR